MMTTSLHRAPARAWLVVALLSLPLGEASAQPSRVELSGGPATPAEIARFAADWMSDAQRAGARGAACSHLYNRFDAGVWGTFEYMDTMARMYALTRAPMYVEDMDEIASCAVLYRDDHHPGPNPGEPLSVARYLRPRPMDQIRNRQSLPAWGGRSINSANLHRIEEVVSSLYAYSLAMTARIVLEDPALHAAYRDRAVGYVNAAAETVALLLTQFEERPDGIHHMGFIVAHPNLRHRWTNADCQRAFDETIASYTPRPAQETIDWHKAQLNNCKRAIELDTAGKPLAFNENNAFAMAMIEVTRALNAPAYQSHAQASPSAGFWRNSLPIFVSRIQRYFRRHLAQEGASSEPRYTWRHSELTDSREDASHGGLSMQYVIALARNREALDRVAAAAEPIAFEPGDLRTFANTFVRMNTGPDMSDKVGTPTPALKDNNVLCTAWLDLSVADRRVYDRCKDRVLRVVNGTQPYLTIGTHAALLSNGR
jgi:hypothetical protein